MAGLYCALVHHPVKDRDGQIITTAITNLDVHDIARSARTFGLAGYFLVTPITAQRVLVDRILAHWRVGAGLRRVPDRAHALSLAESLPDLEAVSARITALEGEPPLTIATAAKLPDRQPVPFRRLADELEHSQRPALILFGTGHGLADSILQGCDRLLPPIHGAGVAYNHLSVRAAAAIVFDRLRGERDP
jgi:hypothetical protein